MIKVPVGQLRDKSAALLIDFMHELIKDEIARQKALQRKIDDKKKLTDTRT